MSTNHTPNYNLSQWERADKVLMDDFNADNAKLDAAIAAVAQRAETLSGNKAEQSALEAETAARTAAVNAINTALAKRGNCRVEVFLYAGASTSDGGYSNVITFSGKPAFFLIAGVNTAIFGGGPGKPVNCVFNVDGRSANQAMQASWSGNTVTLTGDQRALASSGSLVVVFYALDA